LRGPRNHIRTFSPGYSRNIPPVLELLLPAGAYEFRLSLEEILAILGTGAGRRPFATKWNSSKNLVEVHQRQGYHY